MQKCVAGEACDLANPTPEACKCSPDGGVDGPDASPPDGQDNGGACSLHPTCALASASDVNAALGTAIAAPVMKVISDGTTTVTECHYDAADANNPGSVQISYWEPYAQADYQAGRSMYESTTMTSTSTVTTVGDAAFTSAVGKDGVQELTLLSGCLQIQLVGKTSADQLVALAKTIIKRL
ncbi:MAG TPA: hypothetical protein VHH90_04215 [Polyangia bacterium]|nr:hypothetical protein [Polyangia bacterium]HVZ73875.1 hypothetical protein [Polyangia bacterium]